VKRKRRHLTAEFKARVALEAIKGEKTAAEIARENDIAPAQICEWKKQLEERLGEVFQNKGERSKELRAQERKEARLERKIGQLVIEKDFLVKKCKELGIDPNERP
jgi:transposase-like protein